MIKKILLTLIIAISFVIVPFITNATSVKSNITGSLNTAAKEAQYDTSKSGDAALVSLIGGFIKIILGILGIALLGYLMYGGFIWMTAGGEPRDIEKAKDIIKSAIIGIVIISSSYIISNFVMKQLSNTTTSATTTTSTTTPVVK
jgi:hypothetical protein